MEGSMERGWKKFVYCQCDPVISSVKGIGDAGGLRLAAASSARNLQSGRNRFDDTLRYNFNAWAETCGLMYLSNASSLTFKGRFMSNSKTYRTYSKK
jgi:hypothetical protein